MRTVKALGLAVLIVALGALPVMAATTTSSGIARYNHPFLVPFTTETVGTVTVNAAWEPSGKTRYVLTVKHLRNPDDPFSYDQSCQVYEPQTGSGSGQTPGDYTCTFEDALTGYWTAEFRPLSGKVSVTLTVTTP